MFREVRAEWPLQPGPAGERERLHRRAVVGLRGRDHLPALRLAALDVVRARQLQRQLVRLGAAGDEAHTGETLRRDLDQFLREPFLQRIRQALVVHVGEPLGLPAGSGDDVAPSVTERRGHRAAAHRVEVALAVRVLEPGAFAPHHNRVAAVELRRQHECRG